MRNEPIDLLDERLGNEFPEVMRVMSLDHASWTIQTWRGLQSAPTPQTTWSTAAASREVVRNSQENRVPMSAKPPIGRVHEQDARHNAERP
jgi:hypothetical protein